MIIMEIYVSSNVSSKLDSYVGFLMSICFYDKVEADIRRWEIEYQIKSRCLSPILMKPGSSGEIKFKSVLKRQEISRNVGNYKFLSSIIKRRKGNKRNTQWKAYYTVSENGDIFIYGLECYRTLAEVQDIDNNETILKEFDSDKYSKYSLRNNMRNNSKNALYESIMKDVAKVIKGRLNEEDTYGYSRYGIKLAIDEDLYDDCLKRMRHLYDEGIFDNYAYRAIVSEIKNSFNLPQRLN